MRNAELRRHLALAHGLAGQRAVDEFMATPGHSPENVHDCAHAVDFFGDAAPHEHEVPAAASVDGQAVD